MTDPGSPGRDEGPSLGQMLRERREARGLTREQAAQQARVQLVFVRALEEEDYRLLPDEMYLTRFLFEYATFLGLDPASADASFRRHIRRERRTNPLYRAVPRLSVLPWRRILWTAAALLPIIPLVFILLSLAGKERPGPPPAPVVPPAESDDAAEWHRFREPPPPGDATPSTPPMSTGPAPASAAAGGRRPDPGGGRRHILVARAREITWLAVQVDGGPEREVLLREGEIVRWDAARDFVLTVGNAMGVEVTLDGDPVRLPAGRGGVVRALRLPE